MMKRMVVYFASDAHKVMTILVLDIPLLVQLELTQQLPSKCFVEVSLHSSSPFCLLQSVIFFLMCHLFCLFLLSSLCIFLLSLLCCRVLASLMAKSSHSFWTCNRNLIWRLLFTLAYILCRELIKSVGKLR
jgi:hypothetical protein